MDKQTKIQPLLVWGASDLYFIFAVTFTILFGVLAPDLQKQLNISNAQLGMLGLGFFLGFGVTQLLIGGLIDTLGPRLILSISALVAALGLYLLSASQNFSQALLGQIIAGAGFSTSYVGTIYLASMWFSQKHFSLLSGLTLMSANIISATLIFVLALEGAVAVSFRSILGIFVIVALVMSLLLFWIVRKAPFGSEKVAQDSKHSNFFEDLVELIKIPQFWLSAIYFCSTIGVYLAFSSLWNVPASLTYGRDLQTATMMSATLRYGTAIGSLLSGFLASYFGNASLIARIYSSGALFVGAILIFGPVFPLGIAFLLFALLGFLFGGAALGFPIAGQYIPQALKGAGFGLMAAMGYLTCAALQYILGLILSYEVEPGAKPTIYSFIVSLSPLVLVLAVGWLCTLFLKEKKRN